MIKSFLASSVLGVGLFIVTGQAAHGSAGCPQDINGNNVADIDDLLMLISAWGPCSGSCAADIAPPDGNGVVDVEDLLAVINNWGECPCSPANGCVQVSEIWCEDWDLGNYSRWTGDYDAHWSSCTASGFASDKFITPAKSHRSEIYCSSSNSHRGYGGLRFNGDNLVPSFHIASPGGIDAPNGVLVTFWTWLDVPYTFSPTRWLSLLTVTHDCSNAWEQVVTVNIDDSSMRLKPVHVSSVQYAPNAPSFPLRTWTRTTVYINYYTGSMHVWQDGQKVASATFSRPVKKMCQWHWGLYASGPNDDIVLYEENISIVKLNQPLTNFTDEPWYVNVNSACNQVDLP